MANRSLRANTTGTSDLGADITGTSIGDSKFALDVKASRGFKVPFHDYASLSVNGNIETWTYRVGGATGDVVGQLIITYTDGTRETISNYRLD